MKFSVLLLIRFLTILINQGIIVGCPSSWSYDEYAAFLIQEFYPGEDCSISERIAYHVREISKLIGGDFD